jgi:hypothetical protein
MMFTYAADSFFTIGYPHINSGTPCQDYAVSGVGNGFAYAIVSDGCSSSPDTDIGSRLLALNARKAILTGDRMTVVKPEGFSWVAAAQAEALGANPLSLDATLGIIYANDFAISMHIYGDGVVVEKLHNGTIIINQVEWSKNAPGYVNYHNPNFNNRLQEFLNFYGTGVAMTVTEMIISIDGLVSTKIISEISAELGMSGFQHVAHPDAEYAAVMSDGVSAVDGVSMIDVVKELMNFKNTTGEFVKRRALAAQRGWYKNGKGPADDLSVAVIKVSKEDENVNY